MTTHTRSTTGETGEQGVALVVTLFLMAALSALAVSLTFLSQTETFATMNYTMMSQARYAGESGVQKTVNYLLNTYTLPTAAGIATYNTAVSPVTCLSGCTTNGGPVVLSATAGVASNYPDAATVTAFSSAGQGTLISGSSAGSYSVAGTVGYSAYATLMSMQVVGTSVVQTWNITARGTVTGARTATVEVTSTLETPVVGVTGNGYAAFATSSGCGAITFSGSAGTDSYDSTSPLVSGKPVLATTAPAGGNVGTNGNLTESGGVTIKGKLYTPRTGVGTCNNGGGGVAGDALTQSGSATVTEGLVQLPSTWTPPTPAAPVPAPPTTAQGFSHNTACGALANCSLPSGAGSPHILKFTGGSTAATASLFGNVSTSGDVVLHLGAPSGCPCYYNFNSLTISGGSSLVIDGGPVILNVGGAGLSGSATALNLSGGGVLNASFNAANLQISYGGSQPITMSGGTSTSAVVNAPNSIVTLSGGADFYGSVISSKLIDSGGTKIHYDRQLNSMFSTQSSGNPLLTAFSWKKY